MSAPSWRITASLAKAFGSASPAAVTALFGITAPCSTSSSKVSARKISAIAWWKSSNATCWNWNEWSNGPKASGRGALQMPSMLDMIKANAVPANLMHAAANGALSVPPVEVLEILVYLTNNKVFGKQARLTLAGWDLDATQAAVRDPRLPKEILDYFINPQNIRPKLLPNLVENPAVAEDAL